MRANYGMRNRQRGVVAVIMGIAAVALFAFMGISVDLAYTYSRKTELQNGSDAAALAGAKELNQKVSGLTGTPPGQPCTGTNIGAIKRAICAFDLNNTNNFVGSTFHITVANLRLGSCPNPDDVLPLRFPSCTFVAASSVTTDADARNKSFLEVTTPDQTRNTFFMLVAGTTTTSTLGYSVAGRFVTDVTPIGICAIDPVAPATKKYTYPDGTTELLEWGYRRGVAYDLFQLNPLGSSPSQPWLVNPVDTFPGACNNSHGSASFTAPFVCQGNSGIASTTTGFTAYGNSGLSDSVVKALNSRFDVYSGAYGSNQCDPVTAPPDTNIKQYCYSGSGCQTPPTTTPPNDWMESAAAAKPSQQTVSMRPPPVTVPQKRIPRYLLPSVPPTSPTPNLIFSDYGALWSYGPAYHADASSPPNAGTEFTPAEANAQLFMYNTGVAWPGGSFIDTTNCTNNYPCAPGTGFPPTTPAAPYNQTSGKYFQAPAVHPGTRNRRILNLLMVDCANVTGSGGVCNVHLPVVGVGRYFMQKMADPTGSKKLEVEFAGLIEPVPTSEIKLYR